MLASLRTFEKVQESRIFGSLQQNPFFVPPEEFLSELRERRAKQTTPQAVYAWKCNSDIVMAFDECAPGEAEARLRRHDGEYRWFLFRAHPLK